MGNIRHGVAEPDFVLQQSVRLLTKSDGHFPNLALQDGKLALLAVGNHDALTAVQNTVDLRAEVRNRRIPPPQKEP